MAASAALFIWAVVMLIIILVQGDINNRLVSILGAFALLTVPYILELVFRFRFSDFIITFYITYVFFASILGNVMYFYATYPGYDKVMHSLFGYVGCMVGLFALCKLEKNNDLHPVTVAIMCFAVSMALGALWEIAEFFGDNVLGQIAQVPIYLEDGTKITPVTDTMLDIICNFGGALIFVTHYIIHRCTKKNLLMGSIINDFKGISAKSAGEDSEAATE